jgi:dynein intermediate chain
VQKTPLTGSGHTHPIYSIDIVGTQNANNIISTSTDGVVCGWTVDMLAQPQEYISLTTPAPSKTEDLSPTCMAFPRADPTYFLVGTEEGTIYPCHRYDRAGAKAGVDQRVTYKSHAAPVMSLDFHPTKGPIDLGNLLLSASLDWSVKLWKIRAPSSTTTTTTTSTITSPPSPTIRSRDVSSNSTKAHTITPLLDITREDVVYAAAWSPTKPSIFSLVDGAGSLEVWDLNVETEVPVAKAQPGVHPGTGRGMGHGRSLNKLAWEGNEGKRIAVGGLDGVVTVFELGSALGGEAGAGEWQGVRRMVGRLEHASVGG